MPQHVSVIIPLYNHASYIREAVKSVLAEGSVVAEIIVIDDGSTDNSYDVMQEIVPLDRRIVCWTQPNRGAHSAINAGLYRATSKSVAILNSDDAYVAGRLVRLIEALDLDDGADMAASSIRIRRRCRSSRFRTSGTPMLSHHSKHGAISVCRL